MEVMSVMVGVLVLLVLTLGAGAAWLLLQRGALVGRAATAEESARGAEARRLAAEEALTTALREGKDIGERAAAAERERAGLIERVRAGEDAREAALDALRAEHAQELEKERAVHRKELEAMQVAHKALEENLRQYRADLKASFDSLAGNVLKQSTDELIKRNDESMAAKTAEATSALELRRVAVEQLVRPLAETLEKTGVALDKLRTDRAAADARLEQAIAFTNQVSEQLKTNTADLVELLQSPKALGDYGELVLRDVVEAAGMRDYCSFDEQVQVLDADGERYRPDMVVRLPDDRRIVIDAKASLTALARASKEAKSEAEREVFLGEFADNVYERVVELGKKSYWKHFQGSPQLVILFIPGEQFVHVALQRRRDLIRQAADRNVGIASPATLIPLLRMVALAWTHQGLAEKYETLFRLGRDLHKRVETAVGHAVQVGARLNGAVDKCNEFIRSVEHNLLSTAREFEETGISSGKNLPEKLEAHTAIVEPPRKLQVAFPRVELEGAGPASPEALQGTTP